MGDDGVITTQTIGKDLPVDKFAETIEFHFSRIKRIENLDSCMKLKKLGLVSNVIEKIANLDNLLLLEHLDLYQNKIKTIENLDKLMNLRILDLSFNLIDKIQNLNNLINLEELYLSNNKITRVENLSHLMKLTLLELGSNKIREYDEIGRLLSLKALWLGKNKLTKMDLPMLPLLEKCSIQNNRIKEWDQSVMLNCPNLQEFYLSYNELTEIPSFITLMPKLIILDLGNNNISKINILNYNTTIEELWLNDNEIGDEGDLLELRNLKNLKVLYLERNPIQYKLGPSYRNRILDILPDLKQLDATPTVNRTF